MLHVPRFARLLIVALILVVVPSIYFFYPGDRYYERYKTTGLDAGGIDSEHLRPKVPPTIEDEEPRDVQYGIDAQNLAKEHKQDSTPGQSETEHVHDDKHSTAVAAATDVLSGGVIMPHLGNATAKAELGRGTWRFLHLMTLRYPDNPTPDDREALKSFFHLFSRLYPCGECAAHFQKMLKQYPPQTKSRKSASLWLCHVHNIVNERLHKPEFDCLTLDKTYDCGCGNETTTASAAPKTAAIGA